MAAQLLKKITIKDVVGLGRDDDVKAFMTKISGEEPEIMAIVGEVTGFGSKATQYGDSSYLTGSFLAVNRMDGKTYKASKAYLPSDTTETIISGFKNRSNPADVMPIHLTIKVIPHTGQGFTYICEPLKTLETVNKEAQFEASLLALGAPKPLKALPSRKSA